MIELLEKLNQSEEYINLFKSAFELKENKISGVYIQMALSVYVASLTGMDSEFDKYIRGETTKINKDVIHGFNIFMGKAVCGTCHFAPIFNGTVPPDYKDSEHHGIHVDETPQSTSKSLVYYVNDADGDTYFYSNNEKLIKRISPKKGTAVYFPSNTYHASSPPRKTNKRIVINFVFNI
jgi:cytochrome c peroxidase